MAALLRAEQVACATDLEVAHRQREAGAHAGELLDRAEPLGRRAGERGGLVDEQMTVGAVVRPADAAAQLMQIGQPVGVGLVDEDGVRPRDVESALDDRGGQQNVGPPGDEGQHDLLQLRFGEPAVRDDDRRLGHDLGEPVLHLVDVVDAIVHEEHLAAPRKLPVDRGANEPLIPTGHAGLDRDAVGGWRGEVGDVADAEHRHVERPRNRRGGHRQHVHARTQRLEPLLDVHAESLLLVDDHEPEVGEMDVGLSEPMRTDDDVDGATRESLQRVSLLLCAGEPRECPDGEGELGKPRRERAAMLLGQHRCRHEHGHLGPRLGHFEGRPHRHLRLAKADVTAEQSVHRPRPLEVGADRLDGRELVRRLVERKRVLEAPLPGRVGREGHAGAALPPGLQLDHVGGHVGDGPFDRSLLPLPEATTNLCELGGELGASHVFLHQLDAGRRHIDPRALRELDFEKLFRTAMLFEQLQALVAADAVGHVHDIIPLVKIEEGVDRPR